MTRGTSSAFVVARALQPGARARDSRTRRVFQFEGRAVAEHVGQARMVRENSSPLPQKGTADVIDRPDKPAVVPFEL